MMKVHGEDHEDDVHDHDQRKSSEEVMENDVTKENTADDDNDNNNNNENSSTNSSDSETDNSHSCDSDNDSTSSDMDRIECTIRAMEFYNQCYHPYHWHSFRPVSIHISFFQRYHCIFCLEKIAMMIVPGIGSTSSGGGGSSNLSNKTQQQDDQEQQQASSSIVKCVACQEYSHRSCATHHFHKTNENSKKVWESHRCTVNAKYAYGQQLIQQEQRSNSSNTNSRRRIRSKNRKKHDTKVKNVLSEPNSLQDHEKGYNRTKKHNGIKSQQAGLVTTKICTTSTPCTSQTSSSTSQHVSFLNVNHALQENVIANFITSHPAGTTTTTTPIHSNATTTTPNNNDEEEKDEVILTTGNSTATTSTPSTTTSQSFVPSPTTTQEIVQHEHKNGEITSIDGTTTTASLELPPVGTTTITTTSNTSNHINPGNHILQIANGTWDRLVKGVLHLQPVNHQSNDTDNDDEFASEVAPMNATPGTIPTPATTTITTSTATTTATTSEKETPTTDDCTTTNSNNNNNNKLNVAAVAGGIAGGLMGFVVGGPAGAYAGVVAASYLVEGTVVLGVVVAGIATGSVTGPRLLEHLPQQQNNPNYNNFTDMIIPSRILTMGERGTQRKVLLVRPHIQIDSLWENTIMVEAKKTAPKYQPHGNSHGNHFWQTAVTLFQHGRSSINNRTNGGGYYPDSDILGTNELSVPEKITLLVHRTLNNKYSTAGYIYRYLIESFYDRCSTRQLILQSYNSVHSLSSRARRDDTHAVIKHVSATLLETRSEFNIMDHKDETITTTTTNDSTNNTNNTSKMNNNTTQHGRNCNNNHQSQYTYMTELIATAVENLVFAQLYDFIYEEIVVQEASILDTELQKKVLLLQSNFMILATATTTQQKQQQQQLSNKYHNDNDLSMTSTTHHPAEVSRRLAVGDELRPSSLSSTTTDSPPPLLLSPPYDSLSHYMQSTMLISTKALHTLQMLPDSRSAVDKLHYCVKFLELLSEQHCNNRYSNPMVNDTSTSSGALSADSLLKMVCQHLILYILLQHEEIQQQQLQQQNEIGLGVLKQPPPLDHYETMSHSIEEYSTSITTTSYDSDLNAQIVFLEEFARDEQLLRGIEGYALVTLQASLHFLNTSSIIDLQNEILFDTDDCTTTSTTDPSSSSSTHDVSPHSNHNNITKQLNSANKICDVTTQGKDTDYPTTNTNATMFANSEEENHPVVQLPILSVPSDSPTLNKLDTQTETLSTRKLDLVESNNNEMSRTCTRDSDTSSSTLLKNNITSTSIGNNADTCSTTIPNKDDESLLTITSDTVGTVVASTCDQSQEEGTNRVSDVLPILHSDPSDTQDVSYEQVNAVDVGGGKGRTCAQSIDGTKDGNVIDESSNADGVDEDEDEFFDADQTETRNDESEGTVQERKF